MINVRHSRVVSLQPDHIEAIRAVTKETCDSLGDKSFQPESFSRRQGSDVAYLEMSKLLDFKGESDTPERIDAMRDCSLVFKPSGPGSRDLTLYEQAVNEAAAQIAFRVPSIIFHKRDLAILAKKAIQSVGFDFPGSRISYYPPGSFVLSKPLPENSRSEDSSSSNVSSVAVQKTGQIDKRIENQGLTTEEIEIIMRTVADMTDELPQFVFKSREQCSPIEHYVYADASKLSQLPQEQLDDEMEFIRELSAIHGRYPTGPRNYSATLSIYELFVNEAAAWLVRVQPALLTHSIELQALARRVVTSSGLQLRRSVAPELWSSSSSSRSHTARQSNDIHIRLQGESPYLSEARPELVSDLYGRQLNGDYAGPTTTSASAYYAMDEQAGIVDEDIASSTGLDSNDIIQLLGGSQHIAQMTDNQLEDLGRSQFALVDPRADKEIAKHGLVMSVDEVDKPLDEVEILSQSRSTALDQVHYLSVPACGYTSIQTSHLARCVNLASLDLSENALRIFPRRLHLPRLEKLSLTGNRFIHFPLVEQFPQLKRLSIDDKFKQLLNPQLLAYFCPKLKFINGQYFDEEPGEYVNRITQEARLLAEPHIRSKWEVDYAGFPLNDYENRVKLVESIFLHLRERNLPLDEHIVKYRDLLSKLSGFDPGSESDIQFDKEFSEDHPSRNDMSMDIDHNLAASLFEVSDELVGLNLPDVNNNGPAQSNQLQTAVVMDSLGRFHQQVVVGPSPPGAINTSNQIHIGRSLRQGRSVVMTIVRPRGVSGRPIAEFLPGELRNKDYVKGYMASEIYKKAVKDTLGQKATPKKRSGPGRPRRVDTSHLSTGQPTWGEAAEPAPATPPVDVAAAFDDDEPVASDGVAIPPRPKKRTLVGSHKSLRDLCPEVGLPSATATTSVGDSNIPSLSNHVSPIDYDPLHFIRCHAKDNDAGDSETKVWRCLFEPNPMRPEETTHVVATCGGECVCLINCETGKVMKRFKHMEEEFFTIAWTTVEVETGKRTNILAAAGRMREIRLLHPDQLVCYAEMKGHAEDVTAMIFHQTQSTILFSGDSKASILVWDIGIPSVPDYKTRYQLLMRLRCPRLDVNPVLNLVFLPHYGHLVAGCEDGLFAWRLTDLRLEKREREPDLELSLDTGHEVCIDALAQLSDNSLVVKVVGSGEIMVFDFAAILERRKSAVLCGDNEGSIWIYDLDPYLDDLHSSCRKKFFVKPIKILEWPECSVQGNRDEDQQLKESISSGFRNPVVNSVEMSSDGYYLAAVTDNNLVCIWRYAPPSGQLAVAATSTNDDGQTTVDQPLGQ